MTPDRLNKLRRKLREATRGLPVTHEKLTKLLEASLRSGDGTLFAYAVIIAADVYWDIYPNVRKIDPERHCGYLLNKLYDEFKWDFR